MYSFKISKKDNKKIVEFNESDSINDHEMIHLIGIFKQSRANKENNENGKEYSLSNIPKFLKKYKSEALEISMDEMFMDLHQFKGSEPQHDDMSILLLKIK